MNNMIKKCILVLPVLLPFLAFSQVHKNYVPVPRPVSTGRYLVGAFMCPLWDTETRPGAWDAIKKYPERKPVLGWYKEGNPEVTDWEIKYALDHGISFFNICWYRKKDTVGSPPVKELFGHWVASLPHTRYGKKFRYCLMYTDEAGSIMAGIKNEDDFLNNLVPYWISFFKTQYYLKINGKPVFTIYRPERFIADVGGIDKAVDAIAKMRIACKKAGFKGLILMGESHIAIDKKDTTYRAIGIDEAVSYHWPSFTPLMPKTAPADTTIANLEAACWPALANSTSLPAITTVSVGWDSRPWGNTYYKSQWKLPPAVYTDLCERAKAWIDKQPRGTLAGKMLLLDNWNEYGEGHFIFPTEQDGFAYLDAIRKVFGNAGPNHIDVKPNDVGLGPYEAK
jgi:hypothetical protein